MNILTFIQFFETISGLKINLAKSGIMGINIEDEGIDHLAESIGYIRLPWPITYLGVPLGLIQGVRHFWRRYKMG